VSDEKIKIILKTALPWLLALVAGGVLEVWFLVQNLESKKPELEKASLDYNETVRQMNSFNSIQEAYRSFQGSKEKIQRMIVTPDNILDLIQELEEAARATGVILKTSVGEKPFAKKNEPVSREEATEKSKGTTKEEGKVWLQVDVEGDFESTARFIKMIENAEKIISIATLEMKQQKISTPPTMFENKDGSLGKIHTTLLVTNDF